MINGMTILNETICYCYNELAAVLGIFITFSVAIVLAIHFDWSNKSFFGSLIGTVCAIFIITLIICRITTTEYKEYQVTFSEETKIVEVLEKYDIVRQDRDLYTIREKQ